MVISLFEVYFLVLLKKNSNTRKLGKIFRAPVENRTHDPPNSGENSNGTDHPGGNFPEKKYYLSRYSLFTETTEIFCSTFFYLDY